ncbi:MAG TPA: histidine phosphatase family protein [bacterium]|nr:histidine phosphatase family protein [bacterium]
MKIKTERHSLRKKFAVAAISLMLLPVLVQAQTTKEEFFSNIQHAGGILQSYIYVQTQLTPAPEGYKPFYISHYGRHGSRWLTTAGYYNRPEKIFREAFQAGKLTDLGVSVHKRMQTIAADAENRYGALSPRGVIEQKEIAERMFRSYPEVFSTENGRACNIYSRSTVVPRCILSMAANNERLKELNPQIAITREATDRNFYLNSEYETAGKDSLEAIAWDFLNQRFNMRVFLSTLFSDSLYVKEHIENPTALVINIFQIAGDLQDLDHLNIDLYDIFSKEEIFILWQTVNMKWYYDFNSPEAIESSKNLLRNILDCADSAITNGHLSADLRFGHDSYLSPLLALMGVNGLDARRPDPENIDKVWSDFKVTPMAANLQLIFYRNEKTGDVIVKILHCEKEAKIPVPTVMAPYYRWKDMKAYYRKMLDRG